MTPLDRKLVRSLRDLRGQVITIALVVACGIASYITMRSAYDSLVYSRDKYYTEARFGHVFASLERAPLSLSSELEALDGVQEVETRIVEPVLVPLPDRTRPASGTIVSVDHRRRGFALNDIYIKTGRDLDPTHRDEVLVLDGFAEGNHLELGQKLQVVINGTLRPLTVVGTVLSPEYLMPIAPGQLTYDPKEVPVLWMRRDEVEGAFQMDGAFNHVSFTLGRDTDRRGLIQKVDAILEPYGGFGAIARDKQSSNYVLNGELQQLENSAAFVPYLFLGVAALLVNVVLTRLVLLERSTIATLKAVGYRGMAIGLHYLKLVSVIVLFGALLGVVGGAWLGKALTDLYTEDYFRFPTAYYRLEPATMSFAVFVSLGAAVIGGIRAVRGVIRLPPAEAMHSPAPARYRRSLLESIGVWRWLDPAVRMVWRELSRRPLRLTLSAVGISLAVGILVVARSMWDSMDYLVDVQFHRSMREDMNITFRNPVPAQSIGELDQLPGVVHAEGLRSVPVRFRNGHRWRDSVIMGYPNNPRLRNVIDTSGTIHQVPDEGLLLTKKLGEILEVDVGDHVWVELREGDWATRRIRISGFVEESFGLFGHMNGRALARVLGDTGPVNTALLKVDPVYSSSVEHRLKDFPQVVGVSSPQDFKRQFDEQSGAFIGVFTFILSLFAAIIAVGVIYNNARVALSQRSRDLASLRVLGFTRREISTVLFGEQAVQVALAIPLGLWVGHWLTQAMMSNVDPETYRLPVIISTRTYLYAIAVTLVSALVSALLLRQRLARLDLIGVLKTRE